MAFKKAVREKLFLRMAIMGVSGCGKTMTALRIATGLGGNVAVIDTEARAATKYSHKFNFDVDDLLDHSIEAYLRSMKEAAESGYGVLIIDSLSHGWVSLVENNRLAGDKFKGNSWASWSVSAPKQAKLVRAILDWPGDVICTMRARTEWGQEPDERGKLKPVRVGTKPIAGKEIEFEFDMLLQMDQGHTATVLKDRTERFQDVEIHKPDEEFGRDLKRWLSMGGEPEAKPPAKPPWTVEPAKASEVVNMAGQLAEAKVEPETYLAAIEARLGSRNLRGMGLGQINQALEVMQALLPSVV